MQRFELNKEGKAKIDNCLKELLELCQIYQTPMFASVVIGDDGEKTDYNNIIYSATAHKIFLSDDRIRKHTLVAAGFDAVPKRDVLSVDSFLKGADNA